ncbi:MAG TPA: TonB-dependent receptor [Thermoanaerobaculia bacterium]|jgi:hypothetical protein
MPKAFRLYGSAIALLAMLLLAAPALAQFGESVGSIYGKVVDEQGGALPGAAVTLSGVGATQTQVTNAQGEYRFLNLGPGKYTVSLALAGFTSLTHENVVVGLGRSTEITDTLKLSAVAAAVTVTGQEPLLDTRKTQLGAQITPEELKSIPTARDPWVMLQSVPGIQIDRMNVAGSESGQQSTFTSKGSNGGSFAVDGINFTDLTALGASAGYYDFDSFQEIQVITGGADPSIAGDGAHINMITKRGTNEVHGSARVNVVSDHFEWENVPDTSGQAQPIGAGNLITSVQEYGAEAGGPVIKDHLWLWGAYGRNQVDLLVAGTRTDKTTLENFNAKLNAQPLASNSVDVYYQRSDKLKFGRGAGSNRSQETTDNQTTPANVWKVQDSQVFSSNFFGSIQYNGEDGVFTLDPQGGLSPQLYWDVNGTAHNSYYFLDSRRPQRQVKGDVSFFFNTGSLGHELKAGFGYLTTQGDSLFGWPGDGSGGLAAKTIGHDDGFCLDADGNNDPCAAITRDSGFRVEAKYWTAFFGDTMTWDRLTINAGVRWDKQYGDNIHRFTPGNPTFPQVLPDLNYPGTGKEFTWEDWQPRAGVTYAIGANRNTLVKASYARYVATLGTGTIGLDNPLGYPSYLFYGWTDANGDHLVQPGEVDLNRLIYAYYVNPNNPADTSSPSRFDPNLSAPTTDEFVVGVDHELFPNLAVGVAYTHRKFKNFVHTAVPYYSDTNTILTNADYELVGNLSSTDPLSQSLIDAGYVEPLAYSEPYYKISDAVLAAHGGEPPRGFFYTNRSDYDQTFNGIDFTVTKRLSNRWMMRGWFSYNNHKQHVGPNGCVDPTNVQTNTYGQLCRDDNLVAARSVGSGNHTSVYLNSKWQFNINGMYQLPWNFNVAASFLGRQGYPLNYFRTVNAGDGVARSVQVVPTDEARYDNVYELDMRLEKVVPIFGTGSLTISADVFNVANADTVLQRYNRLRRPETNNIKEVQSPRVIRFGARVSF